MTDRNQPQPTAGDKKNLKVEVLGNKRNFLNKNLLFKVVLLVGFAAITVLEGFLYLGLSFVCGSTFPRVDCGIFYPLILVFILIQIILIAVIPIMMVIKPRLANIFMFMYIVLFIAIGMSYLLL